MKFYISPGGADWVANPKSAEYMKNLNDRGHEAYRGGRHKHSPPSFDRYIVDFAKLGLADYLVVTMEPGHTNLHPDQCVEIGYAAALEIPALAVGPLVGPMCLAHAQFRDWIDFLNSPLVKVRRQTPDMATAILNIIRATDPNVEE